MTRSIRCAAAIALGLLLMVPGAAAATPTSRTAAVTVAVTSVKAVSPVDGTSQQLAAGYVIAHRYGNASCEIGSPTVGKAYECFTPQSRAGLYYSCWVQADTHYVLCLDTPWQHKVTRLHVTRGYGDAGGFTTVKRPWGLRLANGDRCLVILGPVHVTQGRRVNYSCNHKGALAGPINGHHKVWTVHAYRVVNHGSQPATYRPLGTKQIAVAWTGAPSQRD